MKSFLYSVTLMFAMPIMAQNASDKTPEADENVRQMAEKMTTLMREPTKAERKAMDLLTEWSQQLTDYLLKHEQPYAQAIGLNQTHTTVHGHPDQDDEDKLTRIRQNYADHINRLVKNETLNIETFQILQPLCFKKELDGFCDRQALLDKQIKRYPNDLSVYTKPLEIAIQNNDNELIKNLMNVMSGTRQMTHVDYLLPEFIDLIKDYIKTNPIPQNALLREKNDLIATTDFTEQDSTLLDEKLPVTQVYIMLIGMQMALPMPPIKPVKDVCQNNPEFSAECLYIAKTLIHHGNTVITQAMGHIINMAVYDLNKQKDMLVASQANHDRFKEYYQCLSNSYSVNNDFVADFFDKNYSEMWLTAENELTRISKIATYLFKKRQAEGADKLIDPDTCQTQ